MLNLRRKLPPMTTLAAFEAASRTLSFTKAAQELCVTQAAISRQIATLEDDLGIKLFVRGHRKIALTPLGQQYQHTITTAIDLIENSTRKIRTNQSTSQVTIAADTSMAYRWLLPRFEAFHAEFPNIKVKIITSDNEAETLHSSVDISLLYGHGHWLEHDAKEIIKEEVFAVCHPSYLKKHPIDDPSQLYQHQLLDLAGHRWDWVDWQQWLAELDIPSAKELNTISFNSFPLLIDATVMGQGIGLGWNVLVDDLIAERKLVRLFDQSWITGRGYFILTKANIGLSRNAKIVYDWLINQ